MTLNEIKANDWAKIIAINLSWEDRRHLMEMGILPGVQIKLISRNFFGNVLLIQVGDTHLALSQKIAQKIKIESFKEKK